MVSAEFDSAPARVTLDDFVRAETDITFGRLVGKSGIGRLVHDRRPLRPEDVIVVRQCYDFMYTFGVFDLSTPVTVSLPGSDRYLSLTVINQDHYVKLLTTAAGRYTLTAADVGTRYAWVMYRIFVDATDESDVAAVNELQDQIVVEQDDRGSFEIPEWSVDDLDQIRMHLRALRRYGNGPIGAFGDEGEVDPIKRLVEAANGWGGIPDHHVRYAPFFPPSDVEVVPYSLTVGDVPVDGFWSVTVYDAEGFARPNDANVYSINDRTAERNSDGTVTIHFGGEPGLPNRLEIFPGWNYSVRQYLPRAEIRDGRWIFPVATPVTS